MFWGYNRLNKSIFKSKPKDICIEDYLYETEWKNAYFKLGKFALPNLLEKEFSQQENEYSKIISRIIKTCDSSGGELICSLEEKSFLARFVINILLRNPWSFNMLMIEYSYKELKENKEIKAINEMLEYMDIGGFESLCELANKKCIFDEQLIGGISNQMINNVEKINLIILQAEKANFITSDFPVLYETIDIDKSVTVFAYIYLPISNNYALLFDNSKTNRSLKNRIVTINSLQTKRINNLYFIQSNEQSKYIIARDKIYLESITEEMTEKQVLNTSVKDIIGY